MAVMYKKCIKTTSSLQTKVGKVYLLLTLAVGSFVGFREGERLDTVGCYKNRKARLSVSLCMRNNFASILIMSSLTFFVGWLVGKLVGFFDGSGEGC